MEMHPMLSHHRPNRQRKADLVAIGQWAIVTGRGWLVHAVHAALVREGLVHE